MASVVKNGQPSMEEILASIRRIVADDPSGVAPLIDLNRRPGERAVSAGNANVGADDSADFELPSMFRHLNDGPGHAGGAASQGRKSRQAPIGRLTDAIRNVAPKPIARAVNIQADPKTSPSDAIAGSHETAFGIRSKQQQSLSTLSTNGNGGLAAQSNGTTETQSTNQSQQGSEMPSGHDGQSATVDQDGCVVTDANGVFQAREQLKAEAASQARVSSPLSNGPQVSVPVHETEAQPAAKIATNRKAPPPRVMAPFRDTRMTKMAPGSESRPGKIQSSAASAPITSDSKADIGAIVPGALDLPGREPEVAEGGQPTSFAKTQGTQGSSGGAYSTEASDPGVTTTGHVPEDEPNPPPLPQESAAAAQQPIEDATADLLRPMLRQWLSENMPRMVEKALHIEVAETVRTDKPKDPA